MQVWLNLKQIQFYLIKIAADIKRQLSYLVSETSSLVKYPIVLFVVSERCHKYINDALKAKTHWRC